MPAASEQCHRVKPPSSDDFHDHHGGCNPHDDASASFCHALAFVKDMIVGSIKEVLSMHRIISLKPFMVLPYWAM